MSIFYANIASYIWAYLRSGTKEGHYYYGMQIGSQLEIYLSEVRNHA